MVKRKNYFFSRCEASDFWWRSGTDFLHDLRLRRRDPQRVTFTHFFLFLSHQIQCQDFENVLSWRNPFQGKPSKFIKRWPPLCLRKKRRFYLVNLLSCKLSVIVIKGQMYWHLKYIISKLTFITGMCSFRLAISCLQSHCFWTPDH